MSARRATAQDAAALVRLRAQLFTDLGSGHGHAGGLEAPGWQDAAARWFADRLGSDSCAAFVVDAGPDVSSCAVGVVHPHVPSPRDPVGAVGQLFNVATLPAHRRRGQARACVEALLEWFREETPVAYVDLHASSFGAGLYTELGFEPNPDPAMRLGIRR